jgi:plasmid stability protein
MSQLTLNDIGDVVWTKLRERAEAHGHTPEAEATEILTQVLVSQQADDWANIDAIRVRLAATCRTFSDSAELIAEDRVR